MRFNNSFETKSGVSCDNCTYIYYLYVYLLSVWCFMHLPANCNLSSELTELNMRNFFFRVMSVPATIIYFTAYDQLKIMYGFKPGEKNIYSPILSGVTARGVMLNRNFLCFSKSYSKCGNDGCM